MYVASDWHGRAGGGQLPSLRVSKGFSGTGSSSSASPHIAPGSATAKEAERQDPVFGKAWSPPASLNGTLTQSLRREDGAAQASPAEASTDAKRHFMLSSSAAAAPLPTATRGGGARDLSPIAASFEGLSAKGHAPPGGVLASTARRVVWAEGDASGGNEIGPLASASVDAAAALDGRAPPSMARPTPLAPSNAAAPKSERVAAIDRFLTKHAASYVDEPQRNACIRRATEDVARVYPSLAPIMLQVNRYIKELGQSVQSARATHAEALKTQEYQLYQRFETFFESKILAILSDKKALERKTRQLSDENYALRQERDEDLSILKRDLMRRLNECEKREDEFRSFRHLIAAVFKTNQQLSNRVEDLEHLLTKHHVDVPPASEDVFRFSQSPSGAAAHGADGNRERRRDEGALGRGHALPPAFMQASQEEMNMARLTLQQELLHCAFDDRSAYRLQISGLKNENISLKFKLNNLSSTVEKLNRYIHEKRFLAPTYDDAGNAVRPMTPRPRDVPFAIETELGIDLKESTSHIVSELAAVATNLKHQLNSALLRLRQATTVSEWMSEDTLVELDVERNGEAAGVLPTFPVNAWPSIPHFLRTTISPDVDNLLWSESDIGAVLLTFFQKFAELRSACRFVRDGRMMAPRVYQQFERREVVLTRLDASKEEVAESEDNVPFGYVVTQFIRDMLMQLTPGTKEATLALPGTLRPRFAIRGEEKVVELEFTRFAYSVWWAAQRFRDTQPLCRLFLDAVNGRVPVAVFDVTEKVLVGVVRYVSDKLDADGSHVLTYQRLVGGVTRLVDDMDAHAARCGVLAVTQTFEENQVPILGGRVRLAALVADESHCVPEAKLGIEANADTGPGANLASARGAASAKVTSSRAVGNLPPTITARRVPGWQLQPLGASVFVRYWRRLVLERYEMVYAFVERAMAPLVVESEVVLGLYLLPVPEALARAGCFDDDVEAKAVELSAPPARLFPTDSALRVPDSAGYAAVAGASPRPASPSPASPASPVRDRYTHMDTADSAYESASCGVPEVTKSYAALLNYRKKAVVARKAAERVFLAAIVRDVLEDLPRLHRSVHFPFAKTAPPQEGEGDDGHGGRLASPAVSLKNTRKAKGSAKGKRRAGAAKKTASASAEKQRLVASANGGKTVSTSPDETSTENGVAQTAAAADRTAPPREGTHVLPTDMVTAPDRELAEWYGFCFALRQRTLHFSERIFSPSFFEPPVDEKRHDAEDDAEALDSDVDEKPFAEHYDAAAEGNPVPATDENPPQDADAVDGVPATAAAPNAAAVSDNEDIAGAAPT